MADSYTKVLEISTKVEDKAYKEFKAQFKRDDFSINLLDKEDADKMAQNYAKVQAKMKKIQQLKEAIADIEMFGDKGSKDILKALKKQLAEEEGSSITGRLKQAFSKDGFIGNKIIDTFAKAGEKVKEFIVDSFKNAFNELKRMSSYNYGTTLFQNQESLNTALQYGLSGEQAYALDKALEFFGASSIEDTFYWNDNQRDLFAEKIGYYTDKYNSLNDSGFFESWDRFQADFKTFKEELMYDIMEWIMDNKDIIYKGFQLITQALKVIITIVGKIADFLGIQMKRSKSEISSKTADIISNYTSSNSTNTLTVNNTFNGVQASNQQQLVNAGELTWSQVKEVLYSQ